jgi:hypothetical protein
MNILRTTVIAAASFMVLAGAQAQTTTQSEMNRGVPDVDVNVGRNANGAVDVNRANTERAQGVPGVDVDVGRNARGAVDADVANRNGANGNLARDSDLNNRSMRPARADRN